VGISIINEFGGLPLISDAFDVNKLLAALSVIRRFEYSSTFNLEDIDETPNIEFSVNFAIKLRSLKKSTNKIKSRKLSQSEEYAVIAALKEIERDFPLVSHYLVLPIDFKFLMSSEAISASCFSSPQTIFLGRKAFITSVELREQIIHELSHNYIYALEEVVQLTTHGSKRAFTLPSGTGNRTASELVGAAAVACTLIKYYSLFDLIGFQDRLNYLTLYLEGCLSVLTNEAHDLLTHEGREVLSVLINFNKVKP